MSILIVSDLHITSSKDEQDPLYPSLIRLVRDRCQPGDTLILAGDVFDVFVGNKPLYLKRYQEFFQEIHAADARGVCVHYIEGNHDFLMRTAFKGTPGVKIHDHELVIQDSGQKFFIAHGDTVDRKDYGYRALRLFFRSPAMKALAASLPGEVVDRIGQFGSQRSRSKKPAEPAHLPTHRMERLRNLYRSYAAEKLKQGYDYVVLGHCHDLDEMSFQIGERRGQYINVGYPRAHGSFLFWSSGEPKIYREKLP
jgi:UDP-2,3-diacylglucosamine hydrolase